jgi:2-polyprenyl-3-methyl-5-hydroxy-6-metoxy-1,4-benzoquinol methylase
MLRQMRRARRFNRWMAETLLPFIGGDVLEVGSGIGNLTEFLSPGRLRYVASDTEEEHMAELRSRFPDLEIVSCDASELRDFALLRKSFDTVLCLNVLEHILDDEGALANLLVALRPGGRALVLVPQGHAGFGSLDKILCHYRRYSRAELESKIKTAGFEIERVLSFNRATFPGWLLNSRLLKRRTLSNTQLRLFDMLVPFWRLLDPVLPWPPTSLIAVARRPPSPPVSGVHAR